MTGAQRSATPGSRLRAVAPRLLGPTLALLLVLALELLSQTVLTVPNPGVLLIIVVFVAGVAGGWSAVLATAGICVVYAIVFFSAPGRPLVFEQDSATHLAVVVGSLLPTMLIAGVVHDRLVKTRSLAAQQQREVARALVASLQDGFVQTAVRDRRIVEVNARMCEITGFERAELIGARPPYPFWPRDRAGEHRRALEEALAGHPGEYDQSCQRKSGKLFPAIVSRSPLRDESGRITGSIATFKDITERQRADDRLRESEEQYRSVADTASDVILSIDEDNVILFANRAAERVFGHGSKALVGQKLSVLIPSELRPLHLGSPQEAADDGAGPRAETMQLRGVHRDGHVVPIEVSFGEVRRAGRSVYTAIIRDVSERVEAAEALRRSEEYLRQAQKMEAVGRLAGGVAHDFNNLLTAINGYTELLLADTPADDPRAADLREIQRAAESATSLTRQLLAFSSRQVLEMRTLDLNEVVRGLEPLLRRLIAADIEFRTLLEDDLPPVSGDSSQLEQVLLNLVINARDAMPDGGRLTIETGTAEFGENEAREHLEIAAGRYVMLTVSDTGVGMDADTRSRVFEPFFTTKERGKGTGLGLATVYGIVTQSGGTIWVYSEPGRGTTFKVYLPETTDVRRAVKPLASGGPTEGGSETILLAEDDLAVRALAQQVLERYGYRVLVTPGGSQAVEAARGDPDAIDLLVSDVVMPEIGGPELAKRIRELRPDLPVVFMSGYTEDAVLSSEMLGQGSAFLAKPFSPDALVRTVRSMLDGRAAVSALANGGDEEQQRGLEHVDAGDHERGDDRHR